MGLEELIKGNKKFQDIHFPRLESEFEDLVEYGQHPDILFIGCSDSRILPDLILDTKPGDMFILRNIGNFVPPYGSQSDFHGSSAAIEYAVSILKVKHIIVCGHSHCGACLALYENLEDIPNISHVKKWLELGAKAKEQISKNTKIKNNKQQMLRETEKISVKYQLDNLLTYPEILQNISNKTLQIHGWYYEIENGTMLNYDKETQEFKPL
jgi:carbonic anhydrase